MQVRIAVCGFAVYGIMALLSNTWELVKDFSENEKVIVLFCIGLIWTVATVTVPVTMSGRTRADHSLSDHATRFVLLGVTLHMIFNLSLMLPTNFWVKGLKANSWLIVAFVLLLCIAIIGHGVTWILVNTSFLLFFLSAVDVAAVNYLYDFLFCSTQFLVRWRERQHRRPGLPWWPLDLLLP
jgi:hypothetical protein